MATETLTSRRVAALRVDAGQLDIWDAVVPGLALRVGVKSKTYFIRYRAHGKQRRLTIGRHPRLSLADARDKARAALAAALEGDDPAAERAERKKTDTTFRALAEEVIAARSIGRWRPKTLKDIRRIVDVELVPAWGERPAGSITRRDVVLMVEGIQKRAPAVAAYVLRAVKLIFNEGLDRQFPGLEQNPAHRLKPPARPPRERFLSLDEIKAVWNGLQTETLATRALLRFTLLTGQRVGSVCSLRWQDIDAADVWHISAENFKGKRAHLVPLSKEARAVIEELREYTGEDEYVFPGRKGAGRASVNKAHQRVRDAIGIPAWTIHDFRRTFRTWATRPESPKDRRDPAGLGVAPHVADAVLGHKELSLGARVYTGELDTYLLSEKREALARWGRFVLAAVSGTRRNKRVARGHRVN